MVDSEQITGTEATSTTEGVSGRVDRLVRRASLIHCGTCGGVRHTEFAIVEVLDLDGLFRVSLRIGHQSFGVFGDVETREQAEWMAEQLATALLKAGTTVA